MDRELHLEPIKQEAWHKQIKGEIEASKRPIDKMSIAEINQMYEQKKFLCDDCGKELERSDVSLEEHITHLINPIVLWSCDDCIIKCMKNGSVIAATEEPDPDQWQIENV